MEGLTMRAREFFVDAQLEAFRASKREREASGRTLDGSTSREVDAVVVETEDGGGTEAATSGTEAATSGTEADAETSGELERALEAVERFRMEASNARAAAERAEAEATVLRRSAAEARAARERAEAALEDARGAMSTAVQAADVASEDRNLFEARVRDAEEGRARAETERDEANAVAEAFREERDELARRLREADQRAEEASDGASKAADAIRERDAASRASDSANARMRSLEAALAEAREDRARAEDDAAQLRRDLDEVRREMEALATRRGDSSVGPGDARRDGGYDVDEEKYALLGELQNERRRRLQVEAELEELERAQSDAAKRAENASRVAAVAEGEADNYRARAAETEKASRAAKREADELERRAVNNEAIIAAVKDVIGDVASGVDEELHLRVRAHVERATRKAEASLAEALEELHLLRSKTKELGESRITSAADADDRVAKLVEVRDRLVEEMNAQTLELERLDAEIQKRDVASQEATARVSELESKLAASNAQNARLIDIIEEQGRWEDTRSSKGVTASAPTTPAKSVAARPSRAADGESLARRLTTDGARSSAALLAHIEARLLQIQSA